MKDNGISKLKNSWDFCVCYIVAIGICYLGLSAEFHYKMFN